MRNFIKLLITYEGTQNTDDTIYRLLFILILIFIMSRLIYGGTEEAARTQAVVCCCVPGNLQGVPGITDT